MRRVAVTGMAGITSLGHSWPQIERNLRNHVSGIETMHEWARYPELNTRLGGPVRDFVLPPHYTRKVTRSMGRVSMLATRASELAIEDAGLLEDETIRDGRMGVAYGSSTGSTDAVRDFAAMLSTGSMGNINATTYLRMMPHTTAANIGVYFGLKGRVIPASSACTSGSQSIGYAYEAIKFGRQQLMVAGGAEELCVSEAAVFDTLFATSTRNEQPKTTPRPFDRERDGLVIGEGACSLVLEELEHARARGARIHAEIVGFGSNSDGDHLTHPNTLTMQRAMALALEDAQLPPAQIGYINAHATATEQGDIAETQATYRQFGANVPVSALKGHMGHTLGACGAIESWLTIAMMNAQWFAPTLNLSQVDERCGALDYIQHEGRRLDCEYAMNNNFAFGGINTSLIFRRVAQGSGHG
ncbi:MAG: beta-ketoacyl-ACP synthase [Gammaproteobacteria bacterium]|nr:beta-ketoacyl-ACP synthase [Gammaproteobacteria bacterium]